MKLSDNDPLKTVTLKRLAIQSALHLGSEFGMPPDIHLLQDVMIDGVILKIVQKVAAEELKVVECLHPADWWEHFKERWFPAWLLRRFPVRRCRVRLEAHAVYPGITLPKEVCRSFVMLDRRERTLGPGEEGGTCGD